DLVYVDSLGEAAHDAEVVVLLTEWDEFRHADPALLGYAVAERRGVDARHALDAEADRPAGGGCRAPGPPAGGSARATGVGPRLVARPVGGGRAGRAAAARAGHRGDQPRGRRGAGGRGRALAARAARQSRAVGAPRDRAARRLLRRRMALAADPRARMRRDR